MWRATFVLTKRECPRYQNRIILGVHSYLSAQTNARKLTITSSMMLALFAHIQTSTRNQHRAAAAAAAAKSVRASCGLSDEFQKQNQGCRLYPRLLESCQNSSHFGLEWEKSTSKERPWSMERIKTVRMWYSKTKEDSYLPSTAMMKDEINNCRPLFCLEHFALSTLKLARFPWTIWTMTAYNRTYRI